MSIGHVPEAKCIYNFFIGAHPVPVEDSYGIFFKQGDLL
jgi:hypothetical protein